MRVLITGACGFVGSILARTLKQRCDGWNVIGLDNLVRRGSERNLTNLKTCGVEFLHADIRSQSDVDAIPPVDVVVDAAAHASVLAGSGLSSNSGSLCGSRQLMEHNLFGTVNLLEKCRRDQACFVMLSTSRVYSINELRRVPIVESNGGFVLADALDSAVGVSQAGINEQFSSVPPLSLYGASKLASEVVALEYGELGQFPVWINRCGLLAGAGQFGRPDQGILSFWIHSHLQKKPIRYIGFDGNGYQTRDCLHPVDLALLIQKQIAASPNREQPRVVNVSGGMESAISLCQLSRWCDQRFGEHVIGRDLEPRPFDLPWLVLDSSVAQTAWDWQPTRSRVGILEEIADHAEQNPDWLELSR